MCCDANSRPFIFDLQPFTRPKEIQAAVLDLCQNRPDLVGLIGDAQFPDNDVRYSSRMPDCARARFVVAPHSIPRRSSRASRLLLSRAQVLEDFHCDECFPRPPGEAGVPRVLGVAKREVKLTGLSPILALHIRRYEQQEELEDGAGLPETDCAQGEAAGVAQLAGKRTRGMAASAAEKAPKRAKKDGCAPNRQALSLGLPLTLLRNMLVDCDPWAF